MDRVIKVSGVGKEAITPDQIDLLLTLNGLEKKYSDTLKKSTAETENLRTLFQKLGFKKSDLKTCQFDIQASYSQKQMADNEFKQVLDGYTYNHQMKLAFKADNELLGKILSALASGNSMPQIELVYTIKNRDKVKNEVLELAVKDATNKAETLAKATKEKLDKILSIDYSAKEINLQARPFRSMSLVRSAMVTMDVQPEDIEVSDSVTIVWSVK